METNQKVRRVVKQECQHISDEQLPLSEFQNDHTPDVHELTLHLVSDSNIVALGVLPNRKEHPHLYAVNKIDFLRWLNKTSRVLRDDLGFDSD